MSKYRIGKMIVEKQRNLLAKKKRFLSVECKL